MKVRGADSIKIDPIVSKLTFETRPALFYLFIHRLRLLPLCITVHSSEYYYRCVLLYILVNMFI